MYNNLTDRNADSVNLCNKSPPLLSARPSPLHPHLFLLLDRPWLQHGGSALAYIVLVMLPKSRSLIIGDPPKIR